VTLGAANVPAGGPKAFLDFRQQQRFANPTTSIFIYLLHSARRYAF
jgi:hypothetical protein